MTALRRYVCLTVEDIDTALALVDNVHAVTNFTLVHKRITFLELLAYQLVDQSRD